MFDDIFDPDYGVDNSPPDGTDIFQFILYYSEEEMNEVKELMKIGIKKEFENPLEVGNASDLIKLLLKRNYGNVDIKTSNEIISSGQASSNVPQL